MAIRLDHGSDELTEVHDINVVPFIDVMQVMNDLRAAGYLKIALVALETRDAK